MKHCLFFTCCLSFTFFSYSQNSKIDSLLSVLKTSKEDTNKVNILNELCKYWLKKNSDSAIYYAEKAKILSEQISFKIGTANSYINVSSGSI